ncbi:MAG: zinc dependent phospholipase C family protein [Spirochaetes bacterium]|nr:zinc dependent phospholipase C family protein [Spirochaetota bacterium]
MPKELTHWYLAKKISETILSLSNSDGTSIYPTLCQCLREAPNTFLLGAVGPDFLFYYLYGPELNHFREAAMVLHGRDGGNTLRPFYSVVEASGGRFGSALGAFLLGYLAHVVADSVFHPLVLYTVGKGVGKSQYEHHVFESVLDLYVWEQWGQKYGIPRTLRELTRGMEQKGELSRERFLRLLGIVSFLGADYCSKALRECLQRFERIQSWFWSAWASRGAKLLKLLNSNLAFFEASFYQQRFYSFRDAFARILEYQHPVLGESHADTLDDLVGQTVKQFFTYTLRMEQLFHEAIEEEHETRLEERVGAVPPNRGILEGFRSLQGPNLETGLFGDRADRILYTSKEGLEGLFGPYGYRYR